MVAATPYARGTRWRRCSRYSSRSQDRSEVRVDGDVIGRPQDPCERRPGERVRMRSSHPAPGRRHPPCAHTAAAHREPPGWFYSIGSRARAAGCGRGRRSSAHRRGAPMKSSSLAHARRGTHLASRASRRSSPLRCPGWRGRLGGAEGSRSVERSRERSLSETKKISGRGVGSRVWRGGICGRARTSRMVPVAAVHAPPRVLQSARSRVRHCAVHRPARCGTPRFIPTHPCVRTRTSQSRLGRLTPAAGWIRRRSRPDLRDPPPACTQYRRA